jgi:membrane-associated phospholipid phosphatase
MSFQLAQPSAAASPSASRPVSDNGAIGHWLLFSHSGVAAQRHMAVVWTCVLTCSLVDLIWLPQSKLSFVPSNWPPLAEGVAFLAAIGILIATAFHRLRSDGSRAAEWLRRGLVATKLLCQFSLPFGALLTAGVTLSYLITAADLPLKDALLARIDHGLGFDWPSFLETTNSNPGVASLLMRCYQATGLITELVILWLCLARDGERLAEFLAVLGLSTVGMCAGMFLAPAAGAFAYFQPSPTSFSNFAAFGEMWTFGHTFNMLRDGSLSAIDLSALDGVVSFPSFHTMLCLMGIYAARNRHFLMAIVLPVNAITIIATMPVGGHHLADVLAGAALTLCAIFFVRWQKERPQAAS